MLCKPLFISVSKGGAERYTDKAECYTDKAERYTDGGGMLYRWLPASYPQGFATTLTVVVLWC